MMRRTRMIPLLIVAFLIAVKVRLYDIWDQYNVPAYIGNSLGFRSGAYDNVPLMGEAGDKIIVMAKMEKENTDWVGERLPDWQNAIYIVDNANASLHTPANKGHEAMAYLTYLIDNYHSLPAVMAFLHSHRKGFWGAWHTDSRLHDNVESLRKLQLDFVRLNGYVNLRCNWSPGCDFEDRDNKHVTLEIWEELFQGTPYPGEVGAACCAQFAVSREQVLQRPLKDYEMFRQWLLDTELTDRRSGRIFEFSWQFIFAQGAVYCPEEKTCYCKVYGQC